jgi:nitrogen fixation/metabolism regulation signal transduction histidine kinase
LRLRQVVHNLVKNAQEALASREEGCLTVSTRVVGDTEGCFYELKVMDTGPGFDQDLLGEMFEPYVTTKTKGTGLGLAIVKKIVEEHGGKIWAENLDGGACVILRLPVIRDIPCPVAAN